MSAGIDIIVEHRNRGRNTRRARLSGLIFHGFGFEIKRVFPRVDDDEVVPKPVHFCEFECHEGALYVENPP